MDYRWLTIPSVFLMACAGSAEPPVEQPVQTVLNEPEAIADTPEGSDPSEAPEKHPDCTGNNLDLDSLAAMSVCNLAKTTAALPNGLIVSLSPDKISAIESKESEARLILANTTPHAINVELDASCHYANMFDLEIFRGGSRLDRMSEHCDVDNKNHCVGHVVGVTIEAGGQAFFRATIPARVATLGPECAEYESRVLSPGRYNLQVRTAFAAEPLSAPLQIVRLERLPKAQCGKYAKEVAALAEPDLALRPAVAKSLAVQCKARQPSLAFADCQRASKTAETLRECNTHK